MDVLSCYIRRREAHRNQSINEGEKENTVLVLAMLYVCSRSEIRVETSGIKSGRIHLMEKQGFSCSYRVDSSFHRKGVEYSEETACTSMDKWL
jgi:hypothetical protein